MAEAPDDRRWAVLGELLQEQRVHLDRRYKNRTLFSDERQINYRLAQDLETNARQNYERSTLTDVEIAYGWAPGSIRAVLAGGEPVAADERKRRLMQAVPDLLAADKSDQATGGA
jgi:hypothetical protein